MTGASSQTVMTFYRFVDLDDPAALRDTLEREAARLDLKGTILLAAEGINGTVSGARQALDDFLQRLRAHPPLTGLPVRHSSAGPGNAVFYRLKVRLKPEIVRLDQPGVRPAERTGEHVDARRWNALLDDPEVLVLDTRNGYEVEIGTFPGAVNPATRSFRQLPDWVRAHLDPARQPRVAMFCTGGIRCEKASAWLLGQGFAHVYQLRGGILGYLDSVAPEHNRWQGECFVFDQRVSVDAALTEGTFEQCFACRHPLSPGDTASADYQPGVSCPHCVRRHTHEQRQAFRERWWQQLLAARRGTRHVGAAQPAARDPD